jgi:hypothetical protein
VQSFQEASSIIAKFEMDTGLVFAAPTGLCPPRLPKQNVPATSVLATVGCRSPHASLMELGVGAFLVLSNILLKNKFAREKITRDCPFTYLLDAKRQFGLPTASEALPTIQKWQQWEPQ